MAPSPRKTADSPATPRLRSGLKVAGLFAGIGGIELGLQRAGHGSTLLCEIDPSAQAVLSAHFPDVPIVADVRALYDVGTPDLIAGGFPCQDLSQAGRTAGIGGSRSGLVSEVFRLVRDAKPRWLLLENVPFMLRLERGAAMRYLVSMLDELGYRWAYRVVDTRAFGLPQRRLRVVMLASATEDPRDVLFREDAAEVPAGDHRGRAVGFYWTEGTRGLGWAVDAIPTLKGGSSLGIPSAPAIWMPDGAIITPDIRDAERLQGFETDWTRPAEHVARGARWKLVGNAVSVPMATWVAAGLDAGGVRMGTEARLRRGSPWPVAAWGAKGEAYAVDVSTWPQSIAAKPLVSFLEHAGTPLSVRATRGFLTRLEASGLRYPKEFQKALAQHLRRMESGRSSHRAAS